MVRVEDLEFSEFDYAVFGIMLAISFGIGIYHAFKSSASNEAFLMGGHSIGVVPMAISLCASFNSAYMILGLPTESYSKGTQFYLMIIGTGIGVVLSAEIWIPVLYRLKVVSIYEYFEMRYKSKFPRILMTLIFIFKTMLYVSIVLYAPTIALASVTSLSWWTCILILGLCSTMYTTLGGMKAIVWTDVFQIFIMIGGILAVLIHGLSITGGLEKVWENAQNGGRIEFFNMSLDPFTRNTVWNVIFGTLITWGSPYLSSQYLVHRCICLDSVAKGKMALYLKILGQVIMVTVVTLIGLVLYSYYQHCDPVLAGVVEKRDAVIPLFVLQEFAHIYGLPGLFVACLFSGALSTLDSALHSLAAVTWEEIKDLKVFRNISDRTETRITKVLSVLFGIAATSMSFLCSNMGSLISTGGTLFGASMGPMFAYTICSVTMPFLNLVGSTSGLIVGQILNIWLVFGSTVYRPPYGNLPLSTENCTMFEIVGDVPQEVSEPVSFQTNDFTDIYKLSYNVYPIIGFLTTALISIVVSLLSGGGKQLVEEDEKYFHPLSWKLFSPKRRDKSLNTCNNKIV